MNDTPEASAKAAVLQTAELAESAKAVAHTATDLADFADRRTTLAADRTLLAAERTYAAWVRTGLAALASGVGARALFKDIVPELLAKLTATALVIFAVMCFAFAVWRQVREGVPPPKTDLRPVKNQLLIVMNALLVLVAIAALIGVWIA